MGKYIKTCRVCGKSYEGCSATQRADGVFRWQEVACSPECGAQYLAAVNAARSVAVAAKAESQPEVEDMPDTESLPDEAPAQPAETHRLSRRERRRLAHLRAAENGNS